MILFDLVRSSFNLCKYLIDEDDNKYVYVY